MSKDIKKELLPKIPAIGEWLPNSHVVKNQNYGKEFPGHNKPGVEQARAISMLMAQHIIHNGSFFIHGKFPQVIYTTNKLGLISENPTSYDIVQPLHQKDRYYSLPGIIQQFSPQVVHAFRDEETIKKLPPNAHFYHYQVVNQARWREAINKYRDFQIHQLAKRYNDLSTRAYHLKQYSNEKLHTKPLWNYPNVLIGNFFAFQDPEYLKKFFKQGNHWLETRTNHVVLQFAFIFPLDSGNQRIAPNSDLVAKFPWIPRMIYQSVLPGIEQSDIVLVDKKGVCILTDPKEPDWNKGRIFSYQ